MMSFGGSFLDGTSLLMDNYKCVKGTQSSGKSGSGNHSCPSRRRALDYEMVVNGTALQQPQACVERGNFPYIFHTLIALN